jgi:hypothetical protein
MQSLKYYEDVGDRVKEKKRDEMSAHVDYEKET